MTNTNSGDRPTIEIHGAHMLRRVFPLLANLAQAATQRDKAGNRQLRMSQYAALILVGLFNPILQSARALSEASGLKAVRKLTGGRKVSLGAFSEASAVFEPSLLEGIIDTLRTSFSQEQRRLQLGGMRKTVSDPLLKRLVAVDASILTVLPSLAAKLTRPSERSGWRLHVHLRVLGNTPEEASLAAEPARGEWAERAVLTRVLEGRPPREKEAPGDILLMDRGYRSAPLFNEIHRVGDQYVCRLMRTDGTPVRKSVPGPDGCPIELPGLTDADRETGVVADELVTIGGTGGGSAVRTDHPVRRITVIPLPGRPSAARQGLVRTDQTGRDELVLATTLLDLPAHEVVRLYEYRWQIELFFRFLKHVLGCGHLLSSRTKGVQIQAYCAIIAALLLALVSGGNVTKRQYERICLYFAGWADDEELAEVFAQPP